MEKGPVRNANSISTLAQCEKDTHRNHAKTTTGGVNRSLLLRSEVGEHLARANTTFLTRVAGTNGRDGRRRGQSPGGEKQTSLALTIPL